MRLAGRALFVLALAASAAGAQARPVLKWGGDAEGGDGADINFLRSADRGLIHIGGIGGGVGELVVSLGIGGGSALGDLLLDEADVFL